jgi:predicted ribosomally synthesized peptide with nif11-like leader
MDAVYSFVRSADLDPDLRQALSQVHGTDAIVRLAASRGLQFTGEELTPVVSLLRFLADIGRDSDLRDHVARAATPAAVLLLAQARGYSFTESELSHLSIEAVRDNQLSDADLGAIAGGVGTQNTALRISVGVSIERQTPQTDFGTVLGRGISHSADVTLTAGQLAAPFIPGGAVLSAAISG